MSVVKYNPFSQRVFMVRRSLLIAVFHTAIAYSLIKLATFFKVSFIVGSSLAFFSGTSLAVPLLGAWLNMAGIISAIGMSMIGSFAVWGIPSAHYLAYYIPGLFAAAAWRYPSHRIIHLGIPALCMVLFMTHSVGLYAFPYALYWLIPIVLYLKQSTSLFAQALKSTFIAHAVGSIIWLYTMPMTAAAWLALIPVVAVERLTFALGMVVLHRGIAYGLSRVATMVRAYARGGTSDVAVGVELYD